MKKHYRKVFVCFFLIIISSFTTAVIYTLILNNHESLTEKQKTETVATDINQNAPLETLQYGQLVGKWDCTVSSLKKDNSWEISKASWIFKYILNGNAIQDF